MTAASVLTTWDLWRVRVLPPMLPLVSLPRFDLGLPLLLSLTLVLVRPVPGVCTYAGLLVYAILIDQTRLQPQFVSFAFLLIGTLSSAGGQLVSRAHLVAMWLWAGLNKLLSPTFATVTGPSIVAAVVPAAPVWLRVGGGVAIATAEVAVGVLACFVKTRRTAAVLAFCLHAGILGLLSPFGRNWNSAVWAWNAALATAGLALIVPWPDSLWRSIQTAPTLARAVAVVLVVSPLGFHIGVVDAYLSHNVYTENVPVATSPPMWTPFQVPVPPAHRLFGQSFALTCREGDRLIIRDPRPLMALRGLALRDLECPSADAGGSTVTPR
jgi:hypothetical protein